MKKKILAKEIKDVITVGEITFKDGSKGPWPFLGGRKLSTEYIEFIEKKIGMPMCYYGEIFHDSKKIGKLFYNVGAVEQAAKELANAPVVECEE